MIEKGKKFQAAVINADQLLESQARSIGDSMMTETKEDRSGSKIGRFFTRMWKHNLASEYYRQKEINKARKDIIESGDLYKGEAAFMKEAETSQHHQDAMNSIIKRFISEYETEMVHRDKGETKEKGSKEVNHDIKELINSYVRANGSMSDQDFKEEKIRILRGHNPEYAQEKSLYADNLLDIAKEVKDAVEHGQKLEEMDFDVDMTFGHAREGLNTESKKTTLDKATEWMGKYKGAGRSLVQSGTMIAAVTIGYSIGKTIGTKFLTRGAKIAGFAGGTVAAGAVAGFKENSRLNRERAQHMRESAKGMKFKEDDMPRREQMEQNRYETKNATEIIKDLEADLERAKAGNLLEDEAQGILARLADVEARIQKGDRQGMDLISYDHFGNVEKDRMQIDLKRAELKVALRKEMASKPMAFMAGENFDSFLNQLTNAEATASLDRDVAEKNQVFREMKKKEITKKVIRAMLIGATFTAALSFVADEVGAYFNPEKDGILEGTFKDNANLDKNASMLEAARRWLFSDEPRMPTDNMQDIPIDGTHMHLPEGVNMVDNGDGTFDIVRNGEVISDNTPLSFDDNGNLSQESRDLLAKDDIYTDFRLDGGTNTIHPKDWVDKNLDNLHRIERTHLGNNTEMYGRDENGQWILHKDPITGRMTSGADLNELRTHWTNGTGFDEKGFYSMNVQHMTDDGSFQDGLSAAAHEEMKNGKLMALLSVTKDSQRFVFEVPIDKDGLFHIDPTSPEGKMLFENVNGHAVYNGAFIEIAKQTGIGKDGHELMQILGTHEGTNTPHDIIEDTTEPHIIFNVPGDTDIDPPFIFVPPVDRRIPLERGEYDNFVNRNKKEIPGALYGYGYSGEGDYGILDRNKYKERLSKKFLENNDYDISENDQEIIAEYLKKQDKVYLSELNKLIENAPAMSKDIEVSITVPAYQEGKNLEKTIRNYAKLNGRDKFEIVIFENHPKDKARDNTKEVIEKMQREFPDMHIVHLYKQFDEKRPIGEFRKYLTDAVLLRKQNAGISNSIAIVSNDADLEDIKPNYALDIAKEFKKDSKLDAIAGKWDYPEKDFEKLPILRASQRLWHYFDIAFRHNYMKSPDLIGRNSAFRSGIYAAIGGYNKNAKLAEDLEIGWMIKDLRNYNSDRIKYVNKAGLVSNSRRAVVNMLSDNRLIQQYGDFHENEEVRNSPLEELLKDKKDFNPETFKKEVQSIYDYYNKWKKSKNGWIDDEYIDKTFDRAMGFMGVVYEKSGDRIEIKDISKMNLDKTKLSNPKNKKTPENPETPEAPKKERKKARVEKISGAELKTEMLNTFTKILKEKGGQATIDKKKFRIDIEGNSIVGHAELKTTMGLGGSPVIDLDLVSGGEGLIFNNTGNRLTGLNKRSIKDVNEAVAGVPHKIKETLEKKYGGQIKKIMIKDGELKMTFK